MCTDLLGQDLKSDSVTSLPSVVGQIVSLHLGCSFFICDVSGRDRSLLKCSEKSLRRNVLLGLVIEGMVNPGG